MIRYLGRRHGGLKYERYDGPRPHTIPFPRWCISANLRSLVLSLSFLPSSSATSSLPSSPPPSYLLPSILSPPPPTLTHSLSFSLFLLSFTLSGASRYKHKLVGRRRRVTRRKKGGREPATRIPVPSEAHLGTPLSAPSNRYDPLFGGHVALCTCARPRGPSDTGPRPTRVLTLGISLAIVKSPTLKRITSTEGGETFFSIPVFQTGVCFQTLHAFVSLLK